LVRLLRLHYSRTGRMDLATRPHEDPLRFRTQLSLAFPASEVSDLHFEREGKVSTAGLPLSEVQVTFMGLVGPSGVLPRPYTELLLERHVQYRDDAAHAFLDIFSHRMTTLFYEAWQKYKFHIEHERNGTSGFDGYLLNLVGLGPRAQKLKFEEHPSALRRELFSYFAGLLSQKPRNALNLEVMLGFYFSLPIKVKQFAGRWLNLEPGTMHPAGAQERATGPQRRRRQPGLGLPVEHPHRTGPAEPGRLPALPAGHRVLPQAGRAGALLYRRRAGFRNRPAPQARGGTTRPAGPQWQCRPGLAGLAQTPWP
jgi:type VI secretion protein, VC_A0111 family